MLLFDYDAMERLFVFIGGCFPRGEGTTARPLHRLYVPDVLRSIGTFLVEDSWRPQQRLAAAGKRKLAIGSHTAVVNPEGQLVTFGDNAHAIGLTKTPRVSSATARGIASSVSQLLWPFQEHWRAP